MPRFRNMNPQQQQRVQQQMQSGNYGSGAAGRVAERRAGRINTTPQLVTDQAPAPQPPPAPAPMQPPAMDQMRPQMPMNRPDPRQQFHAQQLAQWNAEQARPQMPMQKPMFQPLQNQMQDRGAMAGQAIDQMRAKMPMGANVPPQRPSPPSYAQGVQQVEQARQFQPMQKPMGDYQQGY